MKEVCNSFDVLLDRDRTVYRAYQLERSRLRSRHPHVIWIYIKRWFQHGEFYDSHGDDSTQLGGDFIINSEGILKLAYPSHDPADRPLVDDLLKILGAIEEKAA